MSIAGGVCRLCGRGWETALMKVRGREGMMLAIVHSVSSLMRISTSIQKKRRKLRMLCGWNSTETISRSNV